ncbi:MAG: hypothetical protein H6597_06345 [Flavobacteriales bacterium]|nr:hypothetical protein [Flavobacteriales bacterium]MCB9194135.1 hypothetical protein [Flavobacteriales bacterium]
MRPIRTDLLLAAICTLGPLMPAFADPPPADRYEEQAVILTGWLAVEDLSVRDVLVEVEVNGSVRSPRVSESGRFTVSLPADAEAHLRFSKPGHLTKEIIVDTHHLWDGEFKQKQRHVKFAVILTLERHMGGLTYAGPVGSIGFDDGGGCIAVAHDRRMVPAKRGRVMVF